MNSFSSRIPIVFVAFILFLSGCAAGNLSADINRLQTELEHLKTQSSLSCAPRELASAEANLEFAREDLERRQFISCADRLDRLEKDIQSVKEFALKCAQASNDQRGQTKSTPTDSGKEASASDHP